MLEKTATKTCPECGKEFEHQLRYESKRTFCSKTCRLRAWHRERLQKEPDKVRAEWRAAHKRKRPQRLARMKRYHAENRDRLLEQRRQEYAAHPEKYKALDRARWRGDRKTKGNEMRKSLEQKVRLIRPWEKMLFAAAQRAKKKNVPFELRRSWAEQRWTGKCELTGIEFFLGQRGSGPKGLSPSIDRIKPELGYVPENCRFVIWAVNALKHDGDDELMYIVAEKLLEYRYKSRA